LPYIVDFENVSTVGLESSPVAEALAGLRANEAREVTSFDVDGFRMAYVFYESGLSINVMYGIKDGEKAQSGSNSQNAWKFPGN
jgi:hypothetical protein